MGSLGLKPPSSATVEIFARLQQIVVNGKVMVGSATVEIFARLQLLR